MEIIIEIFEEVKQVKIMNCEKQYFMITTNFMPDYSNEFLPVEHDIYRNKTTGELYRKRALCDFGWGRESGYVLLPELTFEELIKLVEYQPPKIRRNPFFIFSKKLVELNSLCWNNAFAAISVIMEDYVDELISFLTVKIDTDYFKDKAVRKRFRFFRFDKEMAEQYGMRVGGTVGVKIGDTYQIKSYEQIFQAHKDWPSISKKVIDLVYLDK